MKILATLTSLLIMFNPEKQMPKTVLKYIAFGDSYTICTGTTITNEHWPNILIKHIKNKYHRLCNIINWRE